MKNDSRRLSRSLKQKGKREARIPNLVATQTLAAGANPGATDDRVKYKGNHHPSQQAQTNRRTFAALHCVPARRALRGRQTPNHQIPPTCPHQATQRWRCSTTRAGVACQHGMIGVRYQPATFPPRTLGTSPQDQLSVRIIAATPGPVCLGGEAVVCFDQTGKGAVDGVAGGGWIGGGRAVVQGGPGGSPARQKTRAPRRQLGSSKVGREGGSR